MYYVADNRTIRDSNGKKVAVADTPAIALRTAAVMTITEASQDGKVALCESDPTPEGKAIRNAITLLSFAG